MALLTNIILNYIKSIIIIYTYKFNKSLIILITRMTLLILILSNMIAKFKILMLNHTYITYN